MSIKKVWIAEGCIACGVCETNAPEVFSIPDTAVVKKGINYNDYESDIRDTAQICPVGVINYE